MKLTLDLTTAIKERLSREAAKRNLPLKEYALQLLANGDARQRPMTGSELMAYWEQEGLLGTRKGVRDSQVHARKVRRAAERRRED